MEAHQPTIFKIDQWYVDTQKGQIYNDECSTELEPKVMAVLSVLMRYSGEVVTQETIFEQVWPGRIFSPGSVQRCIKELRKAIKEEAKSANIITTHAKRGYCLNCHPISVPSQQRVKANDKTLFRLPRIWLMSATVLFIVLIMWSKDYLTDSDTSPYRNWQRLTATEANESAPKYAPDGKNIAFIRETSRFQRNIWIKHLITGAETKLTDTSGNYHSIAWHPNSKGVMYIEGQNQGDTIGFIPLSAELSKRQLNIELEGYLSNLSWPIENQSFVLCNAPEKSNKSCNGVYQFNWLETTAKQIINGGELGIEQMAISQDGELIATAIRHDQKIQLSAIEIATKEQLFSKQLSGENIDFVWQKSSHNLLVNIDSNLFITDLFTDLKDIDTTQFHRLFEINHHPSEEQVAFTQVVSDQDIYIADLRTGQSKEISNSTAIDSFASLNDKADKVVFNSTRAGHTQVFVYSGGTTSLAYDNKEKAILLSAAVWSPDSNQVAFSINNKIKLVSIETKHVQELELTQSIYAVLGWYKNTDALLVGMLDEHKLSLGLVDLTTKEMTMLNQQVFWANLNGEDEIVAIRNNTILNLTNNQLYYRHTDKGNIVRFVADDEDLFFQVLNQEESEIFKLADCKARKIDTPLSGQARLQDVKRNKILLTSDVYHHSDLVTLGPN